VGRCQRHPLALRRRALHHGVVPLGGASRTPPPAVGATLIAAAVVVLIVGLGWLGRLGQGEERLAVPMVDGVTLPVDDDGHPVEVPPSQPATPVSFDVDGQILRPDPVLARVVDPSGTDVLVRLAPGTTVDTVTGEIVPQPGGSTTTGPGSTSPSTTRPSTTQTTAGTTTTAPPATTTTTTTPTTTTTTEPTTTTTDPTTTTTENPGLLGSVVGLLTP
jgi:hypothetical protein